MTIILIDPNKSAYENATMSFDESKRMRKKAEEARKAIEKTKIEIDTIERKEVEKKARKEKEAVGGIVKQTKEWFHAYHWFVTSDGMLVIGGKSAGQNEEVVKKHLEKDDLFFHADIKGGSVVVLKNGKNATQQSLDEAAQFAACNSNAWKIGYATIDVYAAPKEQVSKSPPPGEYLEKGSFFISGAKRYFRGTPLKLLIGKTERGIECVPERAGLARFSTCFAIEPGRLEKNVIAEKIARQLDGGLKKEDLLSLIPAGITSFSKMK